MSLLSSPHRHVLGMWLMVGVAFVFASHDAVSKTMILVLPVVFVAWARYLIHTLIVTSLIIREKRQRAFHTRRPALHLVRSLFLLGDSLTFLFGLTHVPLAESTALVFLAPAFVTLLSPLVFGIHADRLQWLSVIVGFIGVLVVINPTREGFSLWMLFPLASAFCFAVYQVLTQLAGESDSPSVCSFYVGVFSTAILSLVVPFFWATPSLSQCAMLLMLGGLGMTAHLLISKSYVYASSSVLAPLGYLQILFAAVYGVVFFDSYPVLSSSLGMALICLSGLLVYFKRVPLTLTE
ncbi:MULTISPECIES: DMT family transporter [unclassified Pseudomonas]|uniref:DMT family transporter n=1 Tax=unclassified Pseudomonas TaxID=196821 RepID=UPI000D3AE392|nr:MULTISPECIES: DMT family transporter [unclassified Pseudomonas]RAU44613.1 DMT family transporter [Pseudomonas sp. RIT 409]RAU54951.1 DMT family transporter [Pseudomonas sp. RIT 412]